MGEARRYPYAGGASRVRASFSYVLLDLAIARVSPGADCSPQDARNLERVSLRALAPIGDGTQVGGARNALPRHRGRECALASAAFLHRPDRTRSSARD